MRSDIKDLPVCVSYIHVSCFLWHQRTSIRTSLQLVLWSHLGFSCLVVISSNGSIMSSQCHKKQGALLCGVGLHGPALIETAVNLLQHLCQIVLQYSLQASPVSISHAYNCCLIRVGWLSPHCLTFTHSNPLLATRVPLQVNQPYTFLVTFTWTRWIILYNEQPINPLILESLVLNMTKCYTTGRRDMPSKATNMQIVDCKT